MIIIIFICILLSYILGSKAIFDNKYHPSIYSRIIWLMLATNNFASVLVLQNNQSILMLAGLSLVGNLAILILSLKKSIKTFGRTELISSSLLILSLVVWIFTKLPLLNLTIGLIAHFIGGIPTYTKVIKNPKDEDLFFWLFFCIASALTLLNSDRTSISSYLFPLYFALFDGLMVLFCLRRYIKV